MRSDPSAGAEATTPKPSRKLYGTLFDEEELADGEPARAPATATRGRRAKGDKADQAIEH